MLHKSNFRFSLSRGEDISLTQPFSLICENFTMNHILPKTIHLCRREYAFTFNQFEVIGSQSYRIRSNNAKRPLRCSRSLKIIKGIHFRYQSTARMLLSSILHPISHRYKISRCGLKVQFLPLDGVRLFHALIRGIPKFRIAKSDL